MTPEDIKNLLYMKAKEIFPGIEVFKDEHRPCKKGKVQERIVVTSSNMSNTPWSIGFANLNIFIPYDKAVNYNAPNNARLNQVQKIAEEKLFNAYFEYDGHKGTYKINTISTEEDPETESYYVNVRLYFKVANFKLK
jgi:hypothetical protein